MACSNVKINAGLAAERAFALYCPCVLLVAGFAGAALAGAGLAALAGAGLAALPGTALAVAGLAGAGLTAGLAAVSGEGAPFTMSDNARMVLA